ncbi:Coenzyme F420 hydrogenase/dehydrogenase, beta subunit C-terminal domain [Paracoccus luteus]|uniref:Coenzyme F420 hydrogenase/dehydrogenase, beta subunit C-terminal domain n=1 Tax=Paracoccus luteus TaxID=2508543 RepID=UPI00106FA15D|nr:Coenzyme F420 hydrogenase/dehydrogenase, beta subunit C-terminal domain [Paracoccus luteus]
MTAQPPVTPAPPAVPAVASLAAPLVAPIASSPAAPAVASPAAASAPVPPPAPRVAPTVTPPPALSAAPPVVSPRQIIRSGLCIGCGSCAVGRADRGVGMGWDGYGQIRPQGAPAWLSTPDAGFSARCPFSPAAANEDAIAAARFPDAPLHDGRIGRHISCHVGAVAQPPFRERGSSGGLTTWVAAELMARGDIDGVLHVHPAGAEGGPGQPFFGYRIARTADALMAGARSRYHPVHLAQVLDEVRAVPGRYAVIGIPCFIKAVHLARAQDAVLDERIAVTLGLFCGHMKSARFVTSFAWQMGVDPGRVRAVEYRRKDTARPANVYTAELTLDGGTTAVRDWWNLADGDWGAGYFQNSACNFCDDVVAETADVSFGDAWVEPYSSDGRGTNVVIVRAPRIQALIDAGIADGRLELSPVDAGFVADTQAAGLRQRREGLAYRLTWARRGIRPVKRVAPSAAGLPVRRRAVYRTRAAISAWSHRMARLSAALGRPGLYVGWARRAYAVYEGLTYRRGRLAAAFDRIERRLGGPPGD